MGLMNWPMAHRLQEKAHTFEQVDKVGSQANTYLPDHQHYNAPSATIQSRGSELWGWIN